ncbi:MAG: hypothetical protein NW220_00555 [Leptolyngbyaceae cyanobacterium bins.349]|nr:hypothetical protein [Leptolyngbyaceae cyanobacterium bins.349]
MTSHLFDFEDRSASIGYVLTNNAGDSTLPSSAADNLELQPLKIHIQCDIQCDRFDLVECLSAA